MSYAINRKLEGATFDEAVERTRRALTDQGFGVPTEIDAQSTMKNKLGGRHGRISHPRDM